VDGEQEGNSESADQIIAELGLDSENPVVAYRRGVRFVEALESLELVPAASRARLKESGVYLITGGLGGLGLEIAGYLATHFHAAVILTGRSATAPEDQWEAILEDEEVDPGKKKLIRKLVAIRSAASGMMVVQADVTDADQMRTVVTQAKKVFGTINGVFHAAGVLDDGPLSLKTATSSGRVLDPKVRGTLVVAEVLRDLPISSFVLFSSISSVNPVAGQVDYVAANAFLDAYAAARGDNVIAINWDAWREVGMAARVNSPHPLLGECLKATQQQIVFSGKPGFERLWVCAEHRLTTGKSLLPGTAYLEMASEAFRDKRWPGTLEFQDVFFLAPLAFDTSESKKLRVQLSREDSSRPNSRAFDFSILANEDGWIEHATGRISSNQGQPPPTPLDMEAIVRRCNAREIRFDDAHRTRQERYFDFGPRWRSLQRIRIGKSEALAELSLPDRFASDTSIFHVHPALLDMATGCSLYLIEGYEDKENLYLPFAYNKVTIYRPLPPMLFSHIRHRKEGHSRGDFETFDIELVDDRGHGVAQINGFTMRRKIDAAAAAEIPLGSALPRAARVIEVEERAGLLTQQGLRAFVRVLQADTPSNVVVSSRPLKLAVSPPSTAVAMPAAVTETNGAFEDSLIGWFQELLGVESVALDDDFFDLGGHSLIAVRLFAKIKNTFKVDLLLSTLFEARTVRHLASVLREKLHQEPTAERKWRCLVPVQPNGSRVPFFFIHPVGGEILTYGPLSKALGLDQPFYAFRSLLASQEEIHQTTIEQLASVYVEEMRAFLPEGPYIIGGHSFGGVIAFEMAQQLFRQGASFPLVMMLDVVVPGSRVKLKASAQLATLVKNLRNQGASYLLQKAILKRLRWQWKLSRRVQLLAYTAYKRSGRSVPPELRYISIQESHDKALKSYHFQNYPGKIHVIRATDRTTLIAIERGYRRMESLSEIDDPALGWSLLAEGGVVVHTVEGHHRNMLIDPYVKEVAEVIVKMTAAEQKDWLQDAEDLRMTPPLAGRIEEAGRYEI
jgi:thioesterase domain-containing protein/NAD(P)-dependent dehydrogenase (short-subunit alcohol dehydrogenase family)/acyl carrier protein